MPEGQEREAVVFGESRKTQLEEANIFIDRFPFLPVYFSHSPGSFDSEVYRREPLCVGILSYRSVPDSRMRETRYVYH